jgi:hypothetical protein
MQGVIAGSLSNNGLSEEGVQHVVAQVAYMFADAMIAERNNP